MSLKTLIVDDEPLAREGLRMLLSEDPDISVIEEARNGKEAIEAIERSRPDLVFLDVQMPEMDGLELVRQIGAEQMPPTVFVTAHDRYAVQAFETNALDYLLKPVTTGRFEQALARAKERIDPARRDETRQQLLSLLGSITPQRKYPARLAVRSKGKTVFVDVEDIYWIEAAENYVHLHTETKDHLLTGTMTGIEKSLNPEIFARIHRSAIVNVSCIREIHPSIHGEYVVTLKNGATLHSGRLYRDKLKDLISNPF